MFCMTLTALLLDVAGPHSVADDGLGIAMARTSRGGPASSGRRAPC